MSNILRRDLLKCLSLGAAAAATETILPALRAETSATRPDHSKTPGVIVDYLPAGSVQYIGSPSLAVLPDGSYVASHDIFGKGSTRDLTVLFGSCDRGATWKKVGEIRGQWWSSLFVLNAKLYIIGASRENGFVVIRRSDDGGATWTEPKDNSTGLLRDDGKFHCAPVPVVVHKGRVWRAMEDTKGPGGWATYFRAFMMSAPADSDLLKAANWTFSNPVGRDASWLEGKFGGWLEGNAVVTPDGQIVDILRVETPAEEKAAIVRIDNTGSAATFDPGSGFVNFPGGAKKFTIRFDAMSRKYWALVNPLLEPHKAAYPGRVRNALAISCSDDLRTWVLRCVMLYHPDIARHGFQYVDWLIEGEDMIALSRTAFDDGLGGAHNFHDANYLTFHRFKNFRDLTMKDSVPIGRE